jgi:hypothetical protein
MGAVLTAGLAGHLRQAASGPNAVLTAEQASAFASNPNALIDPEGRASLPEQTLSVLRDSMAAGIRPVFWLGAITSVLAFLMTLFLPGKGQPKNDCSPAGECGETMLMAEQTTINARNQPAAEDAVM